MVWPKQFLLQFLYRSSNTNNSMEENQQPLPPNIDVVDLTLDDDNDDDDDGAPKKRAAVATLRENATKKVCQQTSTTTTTTTTNRRRTQRLNSDENDENEIEILEGDAIPGNFAVAVAAVNPADLTCQTAGRDDADCEVIGTKNQTRLPHVSLSVRRVLLA